MGGQRARGSGCRQRRASVTCGRKGRVSSSNPAATNASANVECSVSSGGGRALGAIHATPQGRPPPGEWKESTKQVQVSKGKRRATRMDGAALPTADNRFRL